MLRISVVLSAVVAGFALAGAAHAQNTYGFGTSPPGSFYFSAGTVIAKAFIEKSGGDQMRTQPYASPTQFIPILDRGELEFGIANAFEVVWATRGAEYFTGRQAANLRMVAILVPLRAALFVRKDSDIRAIKDLKGRAVPTGYVSQLILPPTMNAWFEIGGIKLSDVKGVPVPNVVRGAEEFAAGHTEAFAFSLGAAKVQEVASIVGGVRILPLPVSAASDAIVEKYLPYAYVRQEKPSPNLIGVDEPLGALAYDTAVFAAKTVTDEAAYKLARAIHASEAELIQGFKGLEEFKSANMAKKLGETQYHPGAIKFYAEKGMWPPK